MSRAKHNSEECDYCLILFRTFLQRLKNHLSNYEGNTLLMTNTRFFFLLAYRSFITTIEIYAYIQFLHNYEDIDRCYITHS